MKKAGVAAEKLCERLDLPEDVVLNSLKLTVNGSKKALVENHRGILEYGKNRIVISSKRGKLSINGSDLGVVAMTCDELLVEGRIQSVEWN